MAAKVAMFEQMMTMMCLSARLEAVLMHAYVEPSTFEARERKNAAAKESTDRARVHGINIALDP
jgi:hypothetical protein